MTSLREWRHHLHRRPELAFAEHRTAAYLAAELRAMGIPEVATGLGGTGVVASLSRGSGPRIALRADMDCLPLPDTGAHDHVSEHSGTTHACGHDGHMAMVLGAAAALASGGGFHGTVRFVFQPAEEPGRGARAMLDDGLLDRFPVDAVYGLHNQPGLAPGSFVTRPGPIMASEDNFEITITGRGGHAAVPELVIDPLVVAAELILALQTIVARNVPAAGSAVVSCTQITTDGARNAIPGEVVLRGDTRSFTPAVRALLERRIRELTAGICAAHDASGAVTYTHEFEPTVNDPGCVTAAVAAAAGVFGSVDADGPPMLGSEDFGVFADAVPGCFAFIGVDSPPLHSSGYDFDDSVLELGVRYYVNLVRAVLS